MSAEDSVLYYRMPTEESARHHKISAKIMQDVTQCQPKTARHHKMLAGECNISHNVD
jgi:hypothetical protein